jgi:hypothetical protein
MLDDDTPIRFVNPDPRTGQTYYPLTERSTNDVQILVSRDGSLLARNTVVVGPADLYVPENRVNVFRTIFDKLCLMPLAAIGARCTMGPIRQSKQSFPGRKHPR